MHATQQSGVAGAGDSDAVNAAGTSPAIVDEGVIHDLLNPLTGLMGHLQLLQELLEDGAFDLSRQRIKGCFDSLSMLVNMLFDLQQLLRLSSTSVQPNREELTVQKLMSDLRTAYDTTIDGDERELVIDCPGGELSVNGDGPLLLRSLVLLLSVARRLSRRSPVTLRVSALDSQMRFAISYEGMALPPALISQLFGPSGAAAQKECGQRVDRGRGLMLVKAVAHLHRGDVTYDSTDTGGRFTLTLPFTG